LPLDYKGQAGSLAGIDQPVPTEHIVRLCWPSEMLPGLLDALRLSDTYGHLAMNLPSAALHFARR